MPACEGWDTMSKGIDGDSLSSLQVRGVSLMEQDAEGAVYLRQGL